MSQIFTAFALAMSLLVAQPEPEPEAAPEQTAAAQKDEALYRRGTQALDDERWTAAIASFRQIVNNGGKRADRAMYWLGHAQFKSGRPADALATLGELRRRYPKSDWTDDAQALELEIRQSAGQQVAPEAIGDEELKLIAISSLLATDQERAVTLIEKILKSKSSRETKERALFVLGQSRSPRAQQLVESIARGSESPELQEEAIQSLGISGKRAALADIYRKSAKREAKEHVLQALMIASDHARLLEVASGETDPSLRAEAVRHLGVLKQTDALTRLYAKEQSRDVKDSIIQGFFIAGDVDSLARLARTEPDTELRASAIRGLGIAGRGTGPVLLQLWNEGNGDAKRAVLEALFIQGDAKTLVALARREQNRELRRELEQRIALMQQKEAQDYKRENLND
jgi:outer membrane protein assembly factor BamD (BamD/ComL family)